jgi:hypothetical protein
LFQTLIYSPHNYMFITLPPPPPPPPPPTRLISYQ